MRLFRSTYENNVHDHKTPPPMYNFLPPSINNSLKYHSAIYIRDTSAYIQTTDSTHYKKKKKNIVTKFIIIESPTNLKISLSTNIIERLVRLFEKLTETTYDCPLVVSNLLL